MWEFYPIKNLAPKKIYYTRNNPDPNPPDIVDNPNQIGEKKKKQSDSFETEITLKRADSLPNELVSLSDIDFDIKFEKYLFRTKSESD